MRGRPEVADALLSDLEGEAVRKQHRRARAEVDVATVEGLPARRRPVVEPDRARVELQDRLLVVEGRARVDVAGREPHVAGRVDGGAFPEAQIAPSPWVAVESTSKVCRRRRPRAPNQPSVVSRAVSVIAAVPDADLPVFDRQAGPLQLIRGDVAWRFDVDREPDSALPFDRLNAYSSCSMSSRQGCRRRRRLGR